MTPEQFAVAIKEELMPLSNAVLAEPMAAYMKNRFEFLGIKTPARRTAIKPLISQQHTEVVKCAEALWELPYREYQYAACDLLQRHGKTLPQSAMPSILRMATAKSWWDTVDALSKVVGTLIRTNPNLVPRVERLANHKNMWLRRIAILHQLGFGKHTDVDRLFRICLANASDPEFFIRKAIGWALREYAHHSPATVRKFLRQNGTKFSTLTIREASKHL